MNATESKLAEIWRQVLGRGEIGRRHDFFLSGGDSLLATKAVLHIRRAWNVGITVRTLIKYPVLADLAHQIELLTRPREGTASHGDG